ncbi:MAG TPA: adenylate kinase [Gaiellaceae bacterium]|nr:adenylate kinase [Gaiellaceae bacterium]
MNVLLLGPQGSGKGTQAARIAEAHAIPHVATGDMFRAAIAEGSPLGLRVQPILESGQLVPDEITVALIRERLGRDDAADGFVLDGFPRNLAQAEALDAMLAEIERPLAIVLLLELGDEICRERMRGRAELEGRADDARPEVIERRLEIYHRETEPVVEHYLGTGKLVKVHAERTIPEVFAEIEQALETVEARA